MTKEISKNLKCILMRNGAEIWLEDEFVKNVKQILLSLKENRFLEIGNEFINTADITGIFDAETMATRDKRKKGEWQCKNCDRWHPFGEQCGCQGGKY